MKSKKPRHLFLWVVFFVLCVITYGELNASPVTDHSTVVIENSTHIKTLTQCRIFALNGEYVGLVDSYERAIDKYGSSYEQIILYYSARAEGFLVGVVYERIKETKITDEESLKRIQTAANSLYLKFCSEKNDG